MKFVLFVLVITCLLFEAPAFSQSSLAVSSGSTTPGGTTSVNLSLTSAAGNAPAAVQWTLTYPASNVSAVAVSTGSAATAAGKSVSCSGGSGSYRCLVKGMNSTSISDGVVAVVSVTMSSSAASTTISIDRPMGASSSGAEVGMTGTGGTITVVGTAPVAVQSLTCTPSTLNTPANSSCAVALNQKVLANTAVSLAGNSSFLNVPGSVTVTAGSSGATFLATAGAVTTNQTAVVTAMLGSSSKTASLSLLPSLSLTSLLCSPPSVVPGGKSSCTLTLNTSTSSPVTASLSTTNAGVSVPASVTVPAGSSTATFTAKVGAVVQPQIVAVLATTGTSTRTAGLVVVQSLAVRLFACSPSQLGSGSSSTCTISLNAAAPSDTTITLSDDSAALAVPASVIVSTGSVSAAFTVTAGNVASTQKAVMTAALGASSQTVSLTLVPGTSVSSLVCSPSNLVPGGFSTCTVSLAKPASATTTISLTNSIAELTVPASVTITAGSKVATFKATGGSVSTSESANITAVVGGSSRSTTLQLVGGLVAAYGFDEGAGETVSDVSGWANTGAITGASWSAAGRFGRALSFNGTSNWVTVNDSASLDLSTGMTLEAWVNPSTLGTAWRTVALKERPGGLAYGLYANSNAKSPSAYLFASGEIGTPDTATLPVGSWTHLAATYDSTVLRLFVNGTEVSTTVVPGKIASSTGVLRIGANAIWPEYFTGLIDEVRVYNRALSLSEIQQDMGTPLSAFSTSIAMSSPLTSVVIDASRGVLSENPISRGVGTRTAKSDKSGLVTRLSCFPRVAEPGAEVGCELRISSRSAMAAQINSSSDEVKVPSVVRNRGGQSRMTFLASIERRAKQHTAVVTASLGGSAVSDSILVTAAGPFLSVPQAQTAKAGVPVDFIVTALDRDDLPVELTVAGAPANSSLDPGTGRFQWTPSPLQLGEHQLTFTAVNSVGQSSVGTVRIEVGSGKPVVIATEPFVCSPKSVAYLRGKWLSEGISEFSDPSGRTLDAEGTKVRVNDQLMPLLSLSATSVSFLCPDLPAGTRLSVVVGTKVGTASPVNTVMREASPMILSFNDLGKEQGVVSFVGSKDLVTPRDYRMLGHPARPDDHILVWGTGFGRAVEDTAKVVAIIGGVKAEVETIHEIDGYVGVYAIQVRVPMTIAVNDAVSVQLRVSTSDGRQAESNVVTVSIEEEDP